jgi:hypothetical protein
MACCSTANKDLRVAAVNRLDGYTSIRPFFFDVCQIAVWYN